VLIFSKLPSEIKNTGPLTKFKKILSVYWSKWVSAQWKNLWQWILNYQIVNELGQIKVWCIFIVICCVVVMLYVLNNETDAWCILVIIYFVGLVFDESTLVTQFICFVSLVFSYCLLACISGIVNFITCYFVIPFSVWRVHHHFCNDHQDGKQYYTTILS
jgi:hypothetical protein